MYSYSVDVLEKDEQNAKLYAANITNRITRSLKKRKIRRFSGVEKIPKATRARQAFYKQLAEVSVVSVKDVLEHFHFTEDFDNDRMRYYLHNTSEEMWLALKSLSRKRINM